MVYVLLGEDGESLGEPDEYSIDYRGAPLLGNGVTP